MHIVAWLRRRTAWSDYLFARDSVPYMLRLWFWYRSFPVRYVRRRTRAFVNFGVVVSLVSDITGLGTWDSMKYVYRHWPEGGHELEEGAVRVRERRVK